MLVIFDTIKQSTYFCPRNRSEQPWTQSIIKIIETLTAPKIGPKCMVLNAESLAKPNAAPALHAELSKNNNIDISFVRSHG